MLFREFQVCLFDSGLGFRLRVVQRLVLMGCRLRRRCRPLVGFLFLCKCVGKALDLGLLLFISGYIFQQGIVLVDLLLELVKLLLRF